jgi:regulator of protease activity HflC (stomatin/prohibitin superfamily)
VFDSLILWSVLLIVGALLLWRMFTTIDQAHVGVVTLFGKYRRILNPGLNILIPFVETVRNKVPVQNRTDQLQFSAITADQAAVHFISTIIFTVEDHTEDTIKLVAFKFIDDASFNTAITSAVEASVREFVATKKQAEVLGLRQEIVTHAKANLDDQLSSWGYLLVDLTVNDIQFDAEVMQSMSRVVAAKNAQTAAEFEGQALLIQRTKEAEAEGAAIRIAAENEATAARLRGEGLAQFREAIAVGFSESAKKLEAAGLDPAILLFSMWTETMRDAAKEGTGNTIFLDGNVTTMEQTMHRLQGILGASDSTKSGKPAKSKK